MPKLAQTFSIWAIFVLHLLLTDRTQNKTNKFGHYSFCIQMPNAQSTERQTNFKQEQNHHRHTLQKVSWWTVSANKQTFCGSIWHQNSLLRKHFHNKLLEPVYYGSNGFSIQKSTNHVPLILQGKYPFPWQYLIFFTKD